MRILTILFLLFLTLQQGYSQQRNYSNEFGFRSDNDAYLAIAQDQYYTNGLFITFRHALKQGDSSRISKKIYELEFGQYMYNANSGETNYIQEVDRPFAAYLYGGLKMNWFSKKESHIQTSLQVGTIGPDALGKEVQEALHNTVGFYTINGWQFQVNNEIGINASLNYSKIIGRKKDEDLFLQSYLNIGNTFSGAGLGALYRIGKTNPIYNSVSYNSRISNSEKDTIPARESFFFVRPLLNFVAYNATIQGGVFRSDKGPVTYQPNRMLFTTELGYMYAKKRWTFNFSLIFQTKDLKQQLENHQYGSISFYYRFN